MTCRSEGRSAIAFESEENPVEVNVYVRQKF